MSNFKYFVDVRIAIIKGNRLGSRFGDFPSGADFRIQTKPSFIVGKNEKAVLSQESYGVANQGELVSFNFEVT